MSQELVLIPKHKYEAALQKKDHDEEKEGEDTKNATQISGDPKTHHEKETDEKEETPETQNTQNIDEESIINSTLPFKYREKVLRVILFLKNHSSIKWNHDGEVTIHGQFIPNSRIVDLVYDIVNPNGRVHAPKGLHIFYEFLNSIHQPMNYDEDDDTDMDVNSKHRQKEKKILTQKKTLKKKWLKFVI